MVKDSSYKEQWENEIKQGVYRSLAHYRRLAQLPEELCREQHRLGLIALLDLIEVFMSRVEIEAVIDAVQKLT